MLFVELAIAIVLVLVSVCTLNQKCMIPGTDRYNRVNEAESKTQQITMARQNLVLSRLRLKETENIDKILQLPPGPTSMEQGEEQVRVGTNESGVNTNETGSSNHIESGSES